MVNEGITDINNLPLTKELEIEIIRDSSKQLAHNRAISVSKKKFYASERGVLLRKKMRRVMKKFWESNKGQETLAKIKAGRQKKSGFAGKTHSEETRRKISESKKGKPSKLKGRSLSTKQKEHLSAIKKGVPKSNRIYSLEERHQIALEYLEKGNARAIAEKYQISSKTVFSYRKEYLTNLEDQHNDQGGEPF